MIYHSKCIQTCWGRGSDWHSGPLGAAGEFFQFNCPQLSPLRVCLQPGNWGCEGLRSGQPASPALWSLWCWSSLPHCGWTHLFPKTWSPPLCLHPWQGLLMPSWPLHAYCPGRLLLPVCIFLVISSPTSCSATHWLSLTRWARWVVLHLSQVLRRLYVFKCHPFMQPSLETWYPSNLTAIGAGLSVGWVLLGSPKQTGKILGHLLCL